MLIKRSPDLKYSDITPRDIYLNRRKFLYGMGLAGGLALAGKGLADLVSPSEIAPTHPRNFRACPGVHTARRKRLRPSKS